MSNNENLWNPKVTIIIQEMLPLLNNEQLLALRERVLERHLVDGEEKQKYSNNNLLQLFITAKQVEGCSAKNNTLLPRTIEIHVSSY